MGDDELVPDEGGVEFEGDDDVEEIGDFEQDAADVDSESQDGAAARTSGCPICGAIIEDLAKLQLHVNACLDTPPVASSSFPPAPKTRYQPKQKPISARSPSPLKPLPIDPSYTLPSPSSTLAPPPRGNPSAFSVLMSQNKDHLAWAAAEQHEVRGPRSGAGRRKAPFYKVMQGMPIAVDAFRYGKIPGVTAYCLTHAHSDHYTNLSSSWKHGPIYCSSTTANLIKLNLSVAPEYVHPLPLNTPTTLPNTGGVQVILLEANHCPGSVLFLFIGRQTVNAGDSPISSPFVGSQRTFRYLHCGDFRACPAHALHPEIKGKKLDLVYLDTTYLNPRYCFPPQRQVVDACASLAKRMVLGTEEEKEDKPKGVTQSVLRGWFKAEPKEEAVEPGLEIEEELALDPEEELDVTFNGDLPPPLPPPPKPLPAPHPTSAAEESKPSTPGKTLVAIGTYSIGKERIVKAIALALGSKIYCDARKRGLLLAQDDPELHSLLTTDPYSCQVHLLPLQSITVDRMQDYLEQFKGLFDRVLGFRPTGWTYVPPAGMDVMPDVSRVIVRDQKRVFDETALKPTRAASQKYMLYGVPYSEHSSFFELTCFALSVDVGKIIATVNVHSASSRGKMQKWFEKWDVERKRRRNAGHEVVQYRTVDYW
ncbi:DRMBL-domain-containing protein [Dacryopinax primogenitus]|uniref:DRMBL-domain-containing protein n=1 Tax=Dacryopinax primogenitus (strain DJM 731) TaxID=1858805 RepID=M5G4W2_DACPD|nr:DRMBL-domain-containing protein [Dacryopinax primogenitus]EJT98792.1 DRMBL-domain-containing protein [Dacryopinax primogenitus]